MSIQWILFSAKGRIPRRWIWFYIIGVFGSKLVLDMVPTMANEDLYYDYDWSDTQSCLFQIFLLLVFVTSIFVSIKRCHDRGHSGAYLFLSLVPLANLWLIIELFFLPGDADTNLYGDPV